jgi:hypothetical protein
VKSWQPRKGQLTRLVQDTVAGTTINSGDPPPMPDSVSAWLAQLALLYGVPFSYLVPDYRMLPPESIRFFYLDPNWTARLQEGALAIGSSSTRDLITNRQLAVRLKPELDQAAALVRSKLRHVTPDQVTVGGAITGFLLRSIAVSGWPGLEVRGTQSGQPIDLLRMDTLSPEVLLVLFAGVPDDVQINEPPEGLHFGIRALPATTGCPPVLSATPVPSTLLRGLGGSYPAGQEIANLQPVAVPLKPGAYAGVVDVSGLVGNLQVALRCLQPPGLGPTTNLTSCELAIEMVRGAGLQEFKAALSTLAAGRSS